MILDDAGQQVGPHQLGILHVRGPHVMAGYWRKPKATAEMLRPGPIAGERMLRTGDWFTQDEDGLLYFHGRSDDIIKCRGQKVSPREIENVLYGLSGVAEAAVVGVPDSTLGEAIRAYVVPQDGHPLAPSHVVRWCRQHLEDHAAPQDVVITETLPHTDNGKLDRKALAAMARG
jgi:acyl-coenzyme A synthetase/AMP-(fatty) acid ligase